MLEWGGVTIDHRCGGQGTGRPGQWGRTIFAEFLLDQRAIALLKDSVETMSSNGAARTTRGCG